MEREVIWCVVCKKWTFHYWDKLESKKWYKKVLRCEVCNTFSSAFLDIGRQR